MKLWTDGRRTTEPSHPISSPGAFGSGELKMYFIFEVLPLVSAVFGTASAVETINKSPPFGHSVPIKKKQLRQSFQNDWPIIALPLVYQIVSILLRKHISEHMVYFF